MALYGVNRDTAIDMLCSESGGDVIEMVDGKPIMPAWWHEGQADHRRDVQATKRMADQWGGMVNLPVRLVERRSWGIW